MKPVAFDYEAPRTLSEAVSLLTGNADAKLMAGGQTLGPMLNLRLVRPALVVDITRIAELSRVEQHQGHVVYGACVTHAAFEDGRVADGTGGALQRVAAGIAYRAVRTRGTIGGSLAHADPAADWLSALAALGAEVLVHDGRASRRVRVAELVTGALETAIADGEILEAVSVPRCSDAARFGFAKICRKTGEFAEAIGAVLLDPERGLCRAVIGATDARPLVIDDAQTLGLPADLDRQALLDRLAEHGVEDAYTRQLHVTALARALQQVRR